MSLPKHPTKSFVERNPHLYPVGDKLPPVKLESGSASFIENTSKPTETLGNIYHKNPDMTPRKSKDEAKLNKTERAYLSYLRMLKVPQLRIQSITLKLADDCRLTCDFTYVDENGRMVFVDVKGWQREDALIKIKMAARLYNEFRFVIVKKSKTGWETTEINP